MCGIMLEKPIELLTRAEYDSIEYTFQSSINEILHMMKIDLDNGLDITEQKDYVDNLIFMIDGISEHYARYNVLG